MKIPLLCSFTLLVASTAFAATSSAPFRLAIVGLDHGHVDSFLAGALARRDVEVVGVVEPKSALAANYAERLHIPPALLYSDLEHMLTTVKPEAVAIFTSTFDHRRVVEACAAHGVHVMMEKPLAVSMEHARAIEAAANAHSIHVIVNYETTWYPSHKLAYDLVHAQAAIGEVRKIVVRSGHQGPKEIGCPPSFLTWLTDPKLNGGGALMDFGCYGADLITWMLDGQRPASVTAVTQQLKPDVYPKVDDDATVILSYPRAQCVIQASWNWPVGRKDMDLYGVTGQILVSDRSTIQMRKSTGPSLPLEPAPLPPNLREPIGYFKAVVRGEVAEHPLSSLRTNMIVTEILDAARKSAQSHSSVELAPR
jgi:predicted dehydrogenase